jgi:hypothetical protein
MTAFRTAAPGDLNQGLMGRRDVCSPTAPRYPVSARGACAAARTGRTDEFPVVAPARNRKRAADPARCHVWIEGGRAGAPAAPDGLSAALGLPAREFAERLGVAWTRNRSRSAINVVIAGCG